MAGVYRMRLLTGLRVKNFKSIRDVKIELGQLNVFIGENGVGKSNLLEAIGMLSMAISGTMNYNGLSERGVRLSTPEVFKSSFKYVKRPQEIRIESRMADDLHYDVTVIPGKNGSRHPFSYKNELLYQKGGIEYAGRSHNGATVNKHPVVKKPTDNSSILLAADASGAMPENVQDSLYNMSRYGIYAPSTPILQGISIDTSRQQHLGLYGGSLATALQTMSRKETNYTVLMLAKMFKWVQSVGCANPDPLIQSQQIHTQPFVVAFVDSFMNKKFNDLYAYDVSEGVLYALFALCLLVHHESPPFFALDNIDSALNPGLVVSLVRRMALFLEDDPGKQILLTSHNPTTLDAMDLFNDQHRLFVVERSSEDGSSQIRRVKPPDGMTRERWSELVSNMKLSELWLSGSIGAIHQE